MADAKKIQADGVEVADSWDALNFHEGFEVSNTNGLVSVQNAASVLETHTTGTVTLSSTGVSVLNAVGAITATLGSGVNIGDIKVITMQTNATSSTVSITNHQTSDPEVATFDAVDETGVFMWTGTEWITLFATCTFV